MERVWRTILLLIQSTLAMAQPSGGREIALDIAWAREEFPLSFPIASGDYLTITSPWGARVSSTLKVLVQHDGLDIAGVPMAQVIASADGQVVEMWPPPGYRLGATVFRGHPIYGGYLVIDHGNGFRTFYAHLSAVYVTGHQRVRRGQIIGRVGATGLASGEHLHFAVQIRERPVNPLLYMRLPQGRGR